MSDASHQPDGPEWFAQPDASGEPGLRFQCTMCGNCCTGPEGYVLVSQDEAISLAARHAIPLAEFLERFTHITLRGRSLTERLTDHGRDCVFLDRTTIPGKAICGVYEDRPAQCRTWPFWRSTLTTRDAWARAKRTCPGVDTGPRFTPAHIRIQRSRVEI